MNAFDKEEIDLMVSIENVDNLDEEIKKSPEQPRKRQ